MSGCVVRCIPRGYATSPGFLSHMDQICPIKIKTPMNIMAKLRTPLGKYPQLALCFHIGRAPNVHIKIATKNRNPNIACTNILHNVAIYSV